MAGLRNALIRPAAWAFDVVLVFEILFMEFGTGRRASFDKLRMRVFPSASKTVPRPERVEGRTLVMRAA
jgi:hypothetical protein